MVESDFFVYPLEPCPEYLWTAIMHFLHQNPRHLQLCVDNIVTLVTTPLVVHLLMVSIVGIIGIKVEEKDIFRCLLVKHVGKQ